MSPKSAQAACTLGDLQCQLPRVLLNCDGPPRFQPSFLLCTEDSETEGVIGLHRVEISEDVNVNGDMQMADVPMVPGMYQPKTLNSVLSVHQADDQNVGSKGCNNGCHDAANTPPVGQPQLSRPINPFGFFGSTNLAPFIISTEEPGKGVNPGPGIKQQSLSEICQCIETTLTTNNPIDPLNTPEGQVALKLCRKLQDYQNTRGFCSATRDSDGVPFPPEGPPCSDQGRSCDPFTGGFSNDPTGYTCQFVPSRNRNECQSDVVCGNYTISGGGKILNGAAVSQVRLNVTGAAATESLTSFVDSLGISSDIQVYNYATRTLINSVMLSSVQGSSGPGTDVQASGRGSALVNNVRTPITFSIKKISGVVTFELRNASTNALLSNGTGETGRALLNFLYVPF
jgi:hypothetical protein